ncbi:uncharacterized protein LOC101234460 isoform X2 [Hydra vulgaris]|uniref:uncharacterized protein LOC101234460 isoform X2 n=1 Tax=Hydra vulgaris TaxID=6087 RepID=UPI001F5FC4BB|nr:uncharacterized protein LOC101234460 isoform X2 [Hydra vulgaris]
MSINIGDIIKVIPTVNPNVGVTATAVVSSDKRFHPTQMRSVNSMENSELLTSHIGKKYYQNNKLRQKKNLVVSSRKFQYKNNKHFRSIARKTFGFNRVKRNLPISNPHPLVLELPSLNKKAQTSNDLNFFKSKLPNIQKYSDNSRFYVNGTLSGINTMLNDEIESKALEGKDFSEFDYFDSTPQKKYLETSVALTTDNSSSLLQNLSALNQTSTFIGTLNEINTSNKKIEDDSKFNELGYADSSSLSREDEEDDDEMSPTDSTYSEMLPDSTSEPIAEDAIEENKKESEKLEENLEKESDVENENLLSDDDDNDDTSPTDEPITTPVSSSSASRKKRSAIFLNF